MVSRCVHESHSRLSFPSSWYHGGSSFAIQVRGGLGWASDKRNCKSGIAFFIFLVSGNSRMSSIPFSADEEYVYALWLGRTWKERRFLVPSLLELGGNLSTMPNITRTLNPKLFFDLNFQRSVTRRRTRNWLNFAFRFAFCSPSHTPYVRMCFRRVPRLRSWQLDEDQK